MAVCRCRKNVGECSLASWLDVPKRKSWALDATRADAGDSTTCLRAAGALLVVARGLLFFAPPAVAAVVDGLSLRSFDVGKPWRTSTGASGAESSMTSSCCFVVIVVVVVSSSSPSAGGGASAYAATASSVSVRSFFLGALAFLTGVVLRPLSPMEIASMALRFVKDDSREMVAGVAASSILQPKSVFRLLNTLLRRSARSPGEEDQSSALRGDPEPRAATTVSRGGGVQSRRRWTASSRSPVLYASGFGFSTIRSGFIAGRDASSSLSSKNLEYAWLGRGCPSARAFTSTSEAEPSTTESPAAPAALLPIRCSPRHAGRSTEAREETPLGEEASGR